MKRIIGKKYYQIIFELESPLSMGSGENETTDSDILLDGQNQPYIPGTAMTGVYRSLLSKEEGEKCFGKLLDKDSPIDESRVIVYDAVLCGNSNRSDDGNGAETCAYITKRDMVALDEYKTAKKGAKFDFQIVEPGIRFITYLELNRYRTGNGHDDEDGNGCDATLHAIIGCWKKHGLSFGAKTMRGYGRTKLVSIRQAEFADLVGSDAWLDFDLYDVQDGNWTDYPEDGRVSLEGDPVSNAQYGKNPDMVEISLALALVGGLSIREYSTDVGEADYRQMVLKSKTQLPVIPGTSWAGAFRAQMKKLGMGEAEERRIFGTMQNRSRISFSESYVKGGEDVEYTRNAIDRFTNATIDGALYKESIHYYGTTELTIRWDRSSPCSSTQGDGAEINGTETDGSEADGRQKSAAPGTYNPETIAKILTAAIMDLHSGYMAVGGLTAIGRGQFRIMGLKVNGGKTLSGEAISYNEIQKLLCGKITEGQEEEA